MTILDKIMELAEGFECCPQCGTTEIESHYCPLCKKRIVTPDDAYWFSEFIKRNKGKLLKDEKDKDALIADLWAIAHGQTHMTIYNEKLGEIRRKILDFQNNTNGGAVVRKNYPMVKLE